jgi:plastocyanin
MFRSSVLAAATIVAGAVVLAGCSSGPKSAIGTTTSTAAGQATTTTSLVVVPVPTSVPNVVADRKNVTLTGCAASLGGWGATGKATNPGSSAVTYELTIFFTTSHATNVNYATASVTVAPGATVDWQANKSFIIQSPPLSCVLRGVSTQS